MWRSKVGLEVKGQSWVVEAQQDDAGRAWLQVAAAPGGNVGLGSGGWATVNLNAPPLTGPPRVPGEPPLSSSVFSVFRRISNNQSPYLSEKVANPKTSPPPTIWVLMAPAQIDFSSSGFASELRTLLSPWMSHRPKVC